MEEKKNGGKVSSKHTPLELLKTLAWIREVMSRAGCSTYELPDRFTVPPDPVYARYVASTQTASRLTVEAVENAQSMGAKPEKIFRGTALLFSKGPAGYPLWEMLDGNLRISRQVFNDELKAVFGKSKIRWGMAFSEKMDWLVQTLSGRVVDDAPAILLNKEAHPVVEHFEKLWADADEDGRLELVEEWQSYFMVAVAGWNIANAGPDSVIEADYVLCGLLGSPIDHIFVRISVELRRVVIGMMYAKTRDKHKSRYAMQHAYLGEIEE